MQNLISSPLNYTGGKSRLLPQILPLFPKRARIFADLFCRGGNVGINASAAHVIYNDRDPRVAGLLRLFREKTEKDIVEGALSIILSHGLSLSRKYGYGHYGCDSSGGLGAYNRNGFLSLRDGYNRARSDADHPGASSLLLYVLVVCAFNNQIRFNSSGEYNMPVGKRDFNVKMETKLRRFVSALRTPGLRDHERGFQRLPY